MDPRQVLISGIGVLSALGHGREAFVDGLRRGRSGIRRLSLFSSDSPASCWAGQVPGDSEQLAATLEQPPSGPWITRTELLALAATREAVADAGLTSADLTTAALVVGSGGGSELRATGAPIDATEIARRLAHQQPPNASIVLSRALGCHGPRLSVMTACSSSALAVGIARDLIRLGRAEVAIAAGCEALTELTFGGFSALKAMDPDPCRPFHAQRRGLTLGEAGVALILESRASVSRRRGASLPADDCWAEVVGYGVSCDAHHITSPPPDGAGALAAMRAALADAGLTSAAVEYVNAHGTGTLLNDAAEAAALRALLGPRASHCPVSSSKAATGHTLAAAGALEIAACAASIRFGFVPPTLRLDRPDPTLAALDLVSGEARQQAVTVALSNSFAFGGHNVSVVLGRPNLDLSR